MKAFARMTDIGWSNTEAVESTVANDCRLVMNFYLKK